MNAVVWIALAALVAWVIIAAVVALVIGPILQAISAALPG